MDDVLINIFKFGLKYLFLGKLVFLLWMSDHDRFKANKTLKAREISSVCALYRNRNIMNIKVNILLGCLALFIVIVTK